jgi:hypothetical protein
MRLLDETKLGLLLLYLAVPCCTLLYVAENLEAAQGYKQACQ